MSKGVKKVLGVAISVFVPFAAPAIAGALGASTALGSIMVGAVGGAAGAKLSGADPLTGAVLGGIGGGLRGAPPTAGASGAAAAGGSTLGASGISPSSVSGATAASGSTNWLTGAGGTGTLGATSTLPSTGTSWLTGAGGTGSIGAGAAQAAGPSFLAALKEVPSVIAAGFKDPKALADLTLRAAGMIAGSAAAGDGLSGPERKLLNAQVQDLEMLRQQNREVFDIRLREAQKLIGEAKYFDPEYFGLQSARRAQAAGASQERAGLRGLTGDRHRAEQRRIRLGTARNVGTAYDSGFGQGVSARTQVRTAGINALPMPSSYTSGQAYQQLGNAYAGAAANQRQDRENIGEFFQMALGNRRALYTGDEDEPKPDAPGVLIGGGP